MVAATLHYAPAISEVDVPEQKEIFPMCKFLKKIDPDARKMFVDGPSKKKMKQGLFESRFPICKNKKIKVIGRKKKVP